MLRPGEGRLSTAGLGEGDSHCPRETTVVEEDASLSVSAGIQTKAAVAKMLLSSDQFPDLTLDGDTKNAETPSQ